MTSHMTNSRRISILKRPLNFYFLAFCCVIYQNLLHRRVYIAVSSWKLLFINFVKNRCISPLRGHLYEVFVVKSTASSHRLCLIQVTLYHVSKIGHLTRDHNLHRRRPFVKFFHPEISKKRVYVDVMETKTSCQL